MYPVFSDKICQCGCCPLPQTHYHCSFKAVIASQEPLPSNTCKVVTNGMFVSHLLTLLNSILVSGQCFIQSQLFESSFQCLFDTLVLKMLYVDWLGNWQDPRIPIRVIFYSRNMVSISVCYLCYLVCTPAIDTLSSSSWLTAAMNLRSGPEDPLLMAFVSRRLNSVVGPFSVVAVCPALILGAAF